MHGLVTKQSIVEKHTNFVDGGRCGEKFCWWRVGFCASIGPVSADAVVMEVLFQAPNANLGYLNTYGCWKLPCGRKFGSISYVDEDMEHQIGQWAGNGGA